MGMPEIQHLGSNWLEADLYNLLKWKRANDRTFDTVNSSQLERRSVTSVDE
jgi:hypothetical protein